MKRNRDISAEEKVEHIFQALAHPGSIAAYLRQNNLTGPAWRRWKRKLREVGEVNLSQHKFPIDLMATLINLRTKNHKIKIEYNVLIMHLKQARASRDHLRNILTLERLNAKRLISDIIKSTVDFKKSKFYSVEERLSIMNLVDSSPLQNKYILSCLGINYKTYLGWVYRYRKFGEDALRIQRYRGIQITRIPDSIRKIVINYKKQCSYLSASSIAGLIFENHGQYISVDSVRNILTIIESSQTSENLKPSPISNVIYNGKKVNDLWLSDFTLIYKRGDNKYYLSPIMDDYSRYILSWRMSKTQKSKDVINLIDSTMNYHRRRLHNLGSITLLVDNAKCYHTDMLAQYCNENNIQKKHSVRYLPATRAKIESFFHTLKGAMRLIKLNSLSEVEEFLVEYIIFYNNQRPHSGINNLPPASIYYGTEKSTLEKRARVKAETDTIRRHMNRQM